MSNVHVRSTVGVELYVLDELLDQRILHPDDEQTLYRNIEGIR